MKAALPASLACCTFALLAADLHAGAILETVERELPSGKQGEVTTIKVDNGRMRVESLEPGQQAPESSVIFRDGALTVLDHEKKTYTVIDKATMEQLGARMNAAMKQMEAQLAQMPPEQRAMVEQMMGDRMPRKGTRVVTEYARTARSESVGSHTCRMWEGKRAGVKTSEVCVVPFSAVAGGNEIVETMQSMAAMMEELVESMDSPWMQEMMAGEWEAIRRIDGYPLLTRTFDKGTADSENVLRSSRSAAVEAAAFEVPPGYKQDKIDLED